MRAKFIYEKFVEDSDPIEDLGLGIRKQISKFMKFLNLPDTDDWALAVCAGEGKLEWVKFLVANGANLHDSQCLLFAVKSGHIDIVRFLLSLKVINPYKRGDYILNSALQNNRQKIAKLILTKSPPPSHVNLDRSLNTAIEKNYADIVKILYNIIEKRRRKITDENDF